MVSSIFSLSGWLASDWEARIKIKCKNPSVSNQLMRRWNRNTEPLGVWLLSWFINIQIEKGALEPQVNANWHICFISLFSKQTGFWFFSFLFIPSHWKGGKEKWFWIHSIFWTPQMNGTLHTHLEQREIERKVDSHRATRTRSKNLDTVQEFPKMIGSSLPKTCHNNTKKQKMFKPHCLTWDRSCFFFFFFNVCHTERKRASGWERTDSQTWVGQEGKLQRGVEKRVRSDRVQERGEWGCGKPFLKVQACSWSASRSSPLPSSCRALSLGLVSSTASEEENRWG